jgi:1,4-dihydroxy-2-naphthoate polyprenyltransferase
MRGMSDAQPQGAPNARPPRPPAAVWIAAVRPQFLTITAVAVLVGLATARASASPIAWGAAFVTLLGALIVHAGANVVNDYYDRFADEGNVERLAPFTGGSRMIQDGLLVAQAVLVYGYALLAATIVLGAGLALAGRPQLWAIGAVGILLAWSYSAPPLRLSGRGVGEFVIAAAWLLVVVGADLVQRGAWSFAPVAAGLPIALLVAAILHANEFPDLVADQAAHKHTIVVKLGPQGAAWAYLGLVGLAYLSVVAMEITGRLPRVAWVSLLSAPASLLAAVTLIRHAGRQPTTLILPALKNTILAAHLHGLLMAAALFYASFRPS